jgi:hypothetical protein
MLNGLERRDGNGTGGWSLGKHTLYYCSIENKIRILFGEGVRGVRDCPAFFHRAL